MKCEAGRGGKFWYSIADFTIYNWRENGEDLRAKREERREKRDEREKASIKIERARKYQQSNPKVNPKSTYNFKIKFWCMMEKVCE
jgi:hypothetical protein